MVETDTTFLRPWVAHLRPFVQTGLALSLTQSENPNVRVTAEFKCCIYDIHKLTPRLAIPLEFSSNGNFRNNHTRLERVREGMELLTMLAAVKNFAVREIFVDLLGVGPTLASQYLHFKNVYPTWQCALTGVFSSRDPIAKKTFPTWENLFGFSDNSQNFSPEFRGAMEKLKSLGLETTGTLRASLKWTTWPGAISMSGNQQTNVRGNSAAVVTVETFSELLGGLFGLQCPPCAQLYTVFDQSRLIDAWTRSSDDVVRQATSHKILTVTPAFAAFMGQDMADVVLALAQTNIGSQLVLHANNVKTGDVCLDISKFGYLVATMVCGQPVCALPGANSNFATIRRRGRCSSVQVEIRSLFDSKFAGLCAALAESSSIRKVKLELLYDPRDSFLDLDPKYRNYFWRWIAVAFASDASSRCVRDLSIDNVKLTERDAAAFADAIECKYPEPSLAALLSGSRHLEYGSVRIQAGTTIWHKNPQDNTDTRWVLCRNCVCRAVYDPFSRDNVVEAVVPGYGICRVELSATSAFSRDSSVVLLVEAANNAPGLRSLRLVFTEVESGAAVTNLLAFIGKEVRSLSLTRWGEPENGRVCLDLRVLASVCPHLEELYLTGISVTVSRRNKAIEIWGLKKLNIRSSDDVDDLATILKLMVDPTLRMSRLIEEVSIGLGRPMYQTYPFSTVVQALRTHNGEYLPVAKSKVPIESKAALISVIKRNARISRESDRASAVRHLDSSILSIIFRFAATPKQRTIN